MTYEPHPSTPGIVSAFRGTGLLASVEPSDGRGLQIHVPGPRGSYALLGCDVDLPSADEVLTALHLQLYDEGREFLDVVFHLCTDVDCGPHRDFPACTRSGLPLDAARHHGAMADALLAAFEGVGAGR